MIAPTTPRHARSLSALDSAPTCAHCGVRRICRPAKAGPGDGTVLLGRRVRIARDGVLCQAGAPVGDCFYIVHHGSFKHERPGLTGQHQITGFFMENELLGLDAIGLSGHPGSVVALEDSEVCELTIVSQRGLFPVLYEAQSRGLLRARDASLLLRHTLAERRLSACLLDLAERHHGRGEVAQRFRLPMSRHDLGDYLGLAPESVSRLFSQFKRAGLIGVTGRSVTLHAPERLRQLATGGLTLALPRARRSGHKYPE